MNRRTLAGIQRKVVKQGRRNALSRFILAKSDKDKIAAWKQDLIRVLHVFNVRSLGLLRIRELSCPLPDRAGDRHQSGGYGCPRGGFRYSGGGFGRSKGDRGYPHSSCRYPHNGRRYPSNRVDRAGRYFQKRPLGRCDLASTNNRMLTIPQTGESPPPAPRDFFGRNELVEKVVGLTENLESIALIGAGGIGKTSIALTVLHHNQVKDRFGDNRRFIRCDQFPASRAHLLARLSEVLGAGVENPKDLTPLRPFLSSEDMIIVLDNAESILDPKGSSAKEMYSVVDELCQFKTVCLCITSRITMVPPRCKRPAIPTLSMEAACDIFYGIYGDSGRSQIINDLLRCLDFHALSVKLLATTAFHNTWNHNRLAKEWDAQRAKVLQTDYNESLATTVELSLASPTFLSLDPNARDFLAVIAFFPQGIDENNLDWLFPTISNRNIIFDKFCALSLTYRSNNFFTMLAPIRDYLCPRDPRSSPLLCTTRDHYFKRLSVDVHPSYPGFEEARWIVLEDVNIEHLLDVFTSADQTRGDTWDVCSHFMQHLVWHKPRQTVLGSKIEALPDNHPSKPTCLYWLSLLFKMMGNHAERKRLLTRSLELWRQRGDDSHAAQTLRDLSDVNRLLGLSKEGIKQAREALGIYERTNNTTWQVACLDDLARSLHHDGQLDAAEEAASRAIGLVSEKGQQHLACRLHGALGMIHESKGEKEKAIHQFKTALGIASPFNWHDILFTNHHDLASLFLDEDEFDEASAHIKRAMSHAVDDVHHLGCAVYLQARVWYGQGRFEDAKLEGLHALKIFEKLSATGDAENCRGLLQKVEQAMKNQSTGS
jgi:tetratricopeptide (TPR) repeat protein